MNNTCVIGWPVAHSRSPLIHNYWMKKYSISGQYQICAVEPKNLGNFLRDLPKSNFIGCNVTIPHKETALQFVEHYDSSVKAIGALNTIYLRGGKTHATSTDGEGFLQNLLAHHPNFNFTDKKVVILGAGGSAKAILERLLRLPVHSITVANRTFSRAVSLQEILGPLIHAVDINDLDLSACDLLINTTSQGMVGQPPLELSLTNLSQTAIVADIVYVPLKTEFLKRAEQRGNPIVPGLGMLLHQAVGGFELWHGIRPEVTLDLHNLVAQNIDPEFVP